MSAGTSNSASMPPFQLEKLPPELQDVVLENICVITKPNGEKGVVDAKTYQMLRKRLLNVALTNKALRGRVLSMFYSSHIFRGTAQMATCNETGFLAGSRSDGSSSKHRMELRASSKKLVTLRKPTPKNNMVYYDLRPRYVHYMELPPFQFRCLIKHLVLKFRLPEYEKDAAYYSSSWLYPLFHLDEMGFEKLLSLKAVINLRSEHSSERYAKDPEQMARVIGWFNALTADFQVNMCLEIEYIWE